jgi:hypothetical protein
LHHHWAIHEEAALCMDGYNCFSEFTGLMFWLHLAPKTASLSTFLEHLEYEPTLSMLLFHQANFFWLASTWIVIHASCLFKHE